VAREAFMEFYGIPVDEAKLDNETKEGIPIDLNLWKNEIPERAKSLATDSKLLFKPQQKEKASVQNWLNSKLIHWVNAANLQGSGLLGSTEGRAKVYTEDTAVYVDNLLEEAKIDKGTIEQIFDFYAQRAAIQISQTGKFHGLFNMYWGASGTLGEDVIIVSSNTRIFEDILKYTQKSGNYKYMALAELILDYLYSLRDERQDLNGLFKDTTVKQRAVLENKGDERGKMVSDNLQVLKALKSYEKFIESAVFKEYYQQHKAFYDKRIKQVADLKASISTWINNPKLFDKDEGYFYVGYNDSGELDKGLETRTQIIAYDVLNGDKISSIDKFSGIKALVDHALMRQKVLKYEPAVPSNPTLRSILRWLNTREEIGFGFGVHCDEKGKLKQPNGPISHLFTVEVARILGIYAKETGDEYEGLRALLINSLKEALIQSAIIDNGEGLSALTISGLDYFGSYHQEVKPLLIALAPTAAFNSLRGEIGDAKIGNEAQISYWNKKVLDRSLLDVTKIIEHKTQSEPQTDTKKPEAVIVKQDKKAATTQGTAKPAAIAQQELFNHSPPTLNVKSLLLMFAALTAPLIVIIGAIRQRSSRSQGPRNKEDSKIKEILKSAGKWLLRIFGFGALLYLLAGLPLFHNTTLYDWLNKFVVILPNLSFAWKIIISAGVIETALRLVSFRMYRVFEKPVIIKPCEVEITKRGVVENALSSHISDQKPVNSLIAWLEERVTKDGWTQDNVDKFLTQLQNAIDSFYMTARVANVINPEFTYSRLKQMLQEGALIGRSGLRIDRRVPEFGNLSPEAEKALQWIFKENRFFGRRGGIMTWLANKHKFFNKFNVFTNRGNLINFFPSKLPHNCHKPITKLFVAKRAAISLFIFGYSL